MTSIFTGVKSLMKADGNTADSRKIKQRMADNIERQRVKLELSHQTEKDVRETIDHAVTYLSLMNQNLPKKKSFDFRIEFHRHNTNEPFSVQFRVGGSGKRFSRLIGLADQVMPVLRSLWLEQRKSGATLPLTPRAMSDVERICDTYSYA